MAQSNENPEAATRLGEHPTVAEAERLERSRSPELDAVLGSVFPVYDKGFVRVVDYMGTEESIVRAARVSYGKGTKKTSEDRGLIRYLLRHSHCYDATTEVLTSRGFVPWPHVCDEDELGTWDEEAGSLCYERPSYLTKDRYNGPLYRVDHGGVDLAVTPRHKMWVKTKEWVPSTKEMVWQESWSLVSAEELGDRSMVRYSKVAPFLKGSAFEFNRIPNDDPQAVLSLMGFFIGDGSKGSTNTIQFHLKKQRKQDYLRGLCTRLGWTLTESHPDAIGATTFSINQDGIGALFDSIYDEKRDKVMPSFMLKLNQECASSVLDGLRNSDGTEKRGTWSYSTSVRAVAQATQILALHAGEAAHVADPSPGTDVWRVMFLSRMREPVINQSRQNTSKIDYDGYVYCAKTRTGVLVVRRNGKVVLSGNTTPFEMCVIEFHVKVEMDTWRQWIRHRMSSTNEYSTRYSEAIDDKHVTLPGEWRVQSQTNKQGSGAFLPEDVGAGLTAREHDFHAAAARVYHERLDAGVAREQARKDLPLSTYTEAYWKIDLHNLLHFLSLRLDKHAQREIRSFAEVIYGLVKIWVPNVAEAFEDYNFRRSAVLLTRLDVAVLRGMLSFGAGFTERTAVEEALGLGWLDRRDDGSLKENRERAEFEAKCTRLGLAAPWIKGETK